MFKNVLKGLLSVCMFSFIIGETIGAEGLKVLSQKGKIIEVEAEGKLTWVKMTNFPNNPWKELALVDEENKPIAILIGKETEKLLDKEGKKIRVKGLKKPEMKIKGESIAVIEVKEIELLEEEKGESK